MIYDLVVIRRCHIYLMLTPISCLVSRYTSKVFKHAIQTRSWVFFGEGAIQDKKLGEGDPPLYLGVTWGTCTANEEVISDFSLR